MEEAFNEAFEIINSTDGWKEEKKNEHGDVVVSRKDKKTGRKIYRVTATIDCDATKLGEKLKDTKDLTNWNTTLTKHELMRVKMSLILYGEEV